MADLAHITVAVLFNSLWEAAIFAFAVGLLLRVLPNLNATTRYAAWCAALVASLLLPIATAVPKISVLSEHHTAVTASPAALTPAHAAAHAQQHRKSPLTTAIAQGDKEPSLPPVTHSLLQAPRFALPSFAAYALFAAWALAALVLLVRLAVNLWRLERLKADALPLPVDYREHLARWTSAEKGKRDVRLCISDAIEVPVAVGLFDSMILIPKHLLDTLAPDEMDQIMLHELGHLRRADDWTNGLQRVLQAIFFFNPAVLFIAQQLDVEREVACDDWVLRETKSVRPYATCLTKMAEVTAWPHRPLAAPGVFITRRGLSLRVERLLRAGRDVRTSLSIGPAGAVAATLIMLFFLVQTVAPSYAFTQVIETPAPIPPIATPAPLPKIKAPAHAPREREKIIYINRTTSTDHAATRTNVTAKTRVIVIPARHVHVPARTIHIPAINVDIKEQRVEVPVPPSPAVLPYNKASYPLPPDFGRNIQRTIQQAFQGGSVGGDYSGENLNGHDFHGQRLTGADFSKADLHNANFSGAVLTGADFSRSNVTNANFSGARMTGCDFSYSNAAGARFDGVSVTGCDFSHSNLDPGAGAAVARGCRSGCDLSGLNLQNADLRSVRISGVDLTGANLRGADLRGGVFSGVDFTRAALDGANLAGATFINCSFEGVDKSRVDFSRVKQIVNGFGDGGK